MSDPIDDYGDLDETSIFQALDDHEVEYVVVGGSAAILWGAQRATRDVDCVAHQTTENHGRLCDALRQMGNPRLRIEGVDDEAAAELSKQLLHPDFFARTAASTWRTDSGSIDILSDLPDLYGQPLPYAPAPRSLRPAKSESLSPRLPTSLTRRRGPIERRTVPCLSSRAVVPRRR